MKNVTALKSVATVSDYLGPGVVRVVRPHEVELERDDGALVVAEMALAFPYRPAVGDVLLVVGKDRASYVIGVLRGAGRTTLALPGDVELRAEGSLTLSGDRGVHVRGDEVTLTTPKLRVVAGAVSQTFTSLWQRVTSLLSVHAAETHTIVDGASVTRAKSATLLTEETATINGREIHLG
jgi:hypothetical protein